MLLETQKIRVAGGAHGVPVLVPGLAIDVMDMTVWVEALRMLMAHKKWPGNHSKTAEQLHERLANLKNKPIYELFSGLGISVPPNIAPHTRKRQREADGNAWAPVEKGDRALLHQTRWQWNAKPFLTKDQDGKMEFDQNGHALLQDGAPLMKIWNDVPRVQKKNKRAKIAR